MIDMKVEYGQITVNGTGFELPVLQDETLVIEKIVFFVANNASEVSAGYFDGTDEFTGSARYQDENTSNCITHYRNISGVKTKVFEAHGEYLDTGEFQIHVTTCTEQTSLKFVVFGS